MYLRSAACHPSSQSVFRSRITASSVLRLCQSSHIIKSAAFLQTDRQDLSDHGRISRKNKEWARTIPIPAEDRKRAYYMVTGCHPGLLDIFTNTARREHLLSLPLKRADIKAEASRILGQFREAAEPNSPNGTHFMAQVSPDFWARAKQKDHDRLMGMLPFASLSLSTLNGHKGIYALITRDEDRSKPLILRKPSVRKKLQEPSAAGNPKLPARNRPASHER